MLDISSLVYDPLFQKYSVRGFSIQVKIEDEQVKLSYTVGKNRSQVSNSTLIRINKAIQLQIAELELEKQTLDIPENKIKLIDEKQEMLISVINNLKKIAQDCKIEKEVDEGSKRAIANLDLTFDEMIGNIHFDGSAMSNEEEELMKKYIKKLPHLNRMMNHWELLQNGTIKAIENLSTQPITFTLGKGNDQISGFDISEEAYIFCTHATRFKDADLLLSKLHTEQKTDSPNMCMTIIDENHQVYQHNERAMLIVSLAPDAILHSAPRDIHTPWVFTIDKVKGRILAPEIKLNEKFANFSKKSMVLFAYLDQIYRNAKISSPMASTYERAQRLRVLLLDLDAVGYENLQESDKEIYNVALGKLAVLEREASEDYDLILAARDDIRKLKSLLKESNNESEQKELSERIEDTKNKLSILEKSSILYQDPPHFQIFELKDRYENWLKDHTGKHEIVNEYIKLFGHEDKHGNYDILNELEKIASYMDLLAEHKEIDYDSEEERPAESKNRFFYHYSHLLSPHEVLGHTFTGRSDVTSRGLAYNEINIEIPKTGDVPFKVCGILINKSAVEAAGNDETLSKELVQAVAGAKSRDLPVFFR